jgi:tricorn protease-like protein
VKVWSARTGRGLLTLEGHKNQVTSVVFSADGKRIGSGGDDRTVKVWDAQTGEMQLSLEAHVTDWVTSVAISADGRFIVAGTGAPLDKDVAGEVKVWDAEGKEKLFLTGHTGTVFGVAISRDSKRIFSASEDRTVRVWSADTGKHLFTLEGHTGTVTSMALSTDGKRIITGSEDETIKVWGADTGKLERTLKAPSEVLSVAISADGKRIFADIPNAVGVWDAETGQLELTLQGHRLGVTSVAISKDGQRLVSGSYDRTVKVWEASLPRKEP